MTEASVLEVQDLEKQFPKNSTLSWSGEQELVRAVDGVSFFVKRGEVLGLVGESGSGKSTLARCVLGLIKPDAGVVRICGEDLLALKGKSLRNLRRRFQAIFQDPEQSLNPRWKAGRIVEEPLLHHRLGERADRRRRVLETLRDVGLDASAWSRYPHEFSGGQRQRIAIARALAPEPSLLVADEPVSALDASVRIGILQLIRRLCEQNCLAVLLISHELFSVRHLCDRVAVMWRGRIVEIAPSEKLFNEPRYHYTRVLLSAEAPGLSEKAGVASVLRPGRLVEVDEGHWVAGD